MDILTPEILRARYDNILAQTKKAALRVERNPEEIRIIAVSKTQPAELVAMALEAGINLFGENYAQEIRDKFAAVERISPIFQQAQWHFIGRLQSNKVKYLFPRTALIHSVDSAELAREISRQSQKFKMTSDVLLQVNTSGEASKSGCQPEEVFSLAKAVLEIPNVKIRGLMTIAAFADDAECTRPMFRLTRSLQDELRRQISDERAEFNELSMGMSADFETAIEEGATLIRVGSALFGERK